MVDWLAMMLWCGGGGGDAFISFYKNVIIICNIFSSTKVTFVHFAITSWCTAVACL